MPQELSRRLLLVSLFALALPVLGGEVAIIDPAKVDADFAVQGEYTGEIAKDGAKAKVGVQVIALGGGKFHAVFHNGGLPGDGWDKSKKDECDGATADGVTTFTAPNWVAKIKDGTMTIAAPAAPAGQEMGQIKRVVRQSPTLGLKPPDGAVVLFDGTSLDEWQKGARMSDDKLLMEGANSVKKFGSGTLHIEFCIGYMPYARGQGRGNSGVYSQSRYECQVLDSFGLAGKNNELGGIYEIADPLLNMCFPPLSWQTYDIEFAAPQFDGTKKVKNARMTVKLNGVVVQQDTEVPRTTRASPIGQEGPTPGPLHLQNHGNPVRYRNIWFLEKK
ncbi:MAG: DUF1080 domain-containing protein [Planctomycetota bacterium]|nr:DUF1080 domain-containing protein [Planctomycetota bacterium]